MKRVVASLVLAQILVLMALAGYAALALSGAAPAAAVLTPMEPPMSRLAGLSP